MARSSEKQKTSTTKSRKRRACFPSVSIGPDPVHAVDSGCPGSAVAVQVAVDPLPCLSTEAINALANMLGPELQDILSSDR